jgi:hypothetical protein
MNTIRTFLENMFGTLPKSEAILKAKEDLYQMMIEKYDDYKKNGKTENEAIGLVISEFGNIDELLDELGIKVEKLNVRFISHHEAHAVLDTYRKQSIRIAIGVCLILFGASLAVIGLPIATFLGLSDQVNLIRMLLVFIFVVPSVGLFISAGLEISSHASIFEDEYALDHEVHFQIDNEVKTYQKTFNTNILYGVLIIISSAIFFIGSGFIEEYNIYLVSLGIWVVAYGTFLLIHKGTIMSCYNQLLKRGDYKPEMKKAEKTTELVAGIVFPLSIVIYLLVSFISGRWDITWIMWPVVFIVFGVIAGTIEEVHKQRKVEK